MEFATFRGKDVAEAMASVKAAFGPNAWIGPTKYLTNGHSGALGHQVVEVQAAPALGSGDDTRPGSKAHLLSALGGRRPTARKPFRRQDSRLEPELEAEVGDDSLAAELQAIRAMIEELHAARSPKDRVAGALDLARFEGALASRLARGAAAAAKKGDDALQGWLRARVGRELAIAPDFLQQPGRRIVLCVGPTGAGKTTTIAKLAARAHLMLGRSILILTVDTYRVGSVAQIQRFAQLMGAPFAVASGVSEFCNAMLKHPADIVFIDTASLPPTDSASTRLVADILASAPDVPVETLLVLPAMIQGRDAERIVRAYGVPKPTALVITKLDETDRAGGAIHAALAGPLPVAYLSNGPRVPEDIASATLDGVLDTIFPE